jgi:hypothetical protein
MNHHYQEGKVLVSTYVKVVVIDDSKVAKYLGT